VRHAGEDADRPGALRQERPLVHVLTRILALREQGKPTIGELMHKAAGEQQRRRIDGVPAAALVRHDAADALTGSACQRDPVEPLVAQPDDVLADVLRDIGAYSVHRTPSSTPLSSDHAQRSAPLDTAQSQISGMEGSPARS
jgi:hypothetical protein